MKVEWTTNARLTCKSSHGGAVTLRVPMSTRHNDKQFGDTYVACIGTCDMICAFKMKFRKDSNFTGNEYALPNFPQTLLVPASLLVKLPETLQCNQLFLPVTPLH